MGRPPKVQREEILAIIEKYIDYFKTNTFPEFSHKIWKIISNDLDGRWQARTAYNHIREDKRGDLTKARRNKGLMTPPPSKAVLFEECDPLIEEEATDTVDDESWLPEEWNGDDVVNGKVFDLLLTREDWEKIKPDEKSTNSSKTLRTGVWPNIIYKAFQKEYRLPCPFMGKWSHVCSNFVPTVSNYFLKFVAYCGDLQECQNLMVGVALTGPSDEGLRLQITTRDTHGQPHVNLKRPMNSDERDEVGEKLEKESAAMFRERLLRDDMKFGEPIPPHVRKLHVYRQVKMEWMKKQLGIDPKEKLNEIQKIQEMAATPQYCNVIRQIGAVEFFVWYCTPEQILVMQEYRRVMKEKAAVAIDASGRFVRKFAIIGKKMTGHILLYTITINFEGSTICVAQMLTTIQTQAHIENWLKSLIPLMFPNPGEVCSDYERAIPMSAYLTYNNMSLKAYTDQCFQWAQLEEEKKKNSRPAQTLILIDVAHLMAMIARWPCLTSHSHPCTKPFFMRCAALMIDCKSIHMFQRIFPLTCAVALHTSQESSIPALKLTVEEAIKELVEYIADRSSIVKDLETSIQKFEDRKGKDASSYTDEDVLSSSAEGKEITLTHGWIKKLIAMVKPSNDIVDVGKAGNIYYCPELVPQLERIGKEFPLWSQAAIPPREKHASSAYQEGYYTHLRERVFKHIQTPCSVNLFLHTHLQSIQSGTNLMSANINDFVHQNAKIPTSVSAKRKADETNEKSDDFPEEPPQKKVFVAYDSDLKSSEKWGGLQNKRIFLDVSSSDEESQDQKLSSTNVQNSEDIEVENSNKAEDSGNERTLAHASSSFNHVKEHEPSPFTANINFNLKNRNKREKVIITDLHSDDEDASPLIDHKSSNTKNRVNTSTDFSEEPPRKNDMAKNSEDLKNNNPTMISAILENDTSASATNKQNGKDEKINYSSESPKIPEHYVGKPLLSSAPLLDHSYCMPKGNDTETCMKDIPVDDDRNITISRKLSEIAKFPFIPFL